VVLTEDLGLAPENDRLRHENRILKEEREILKKATMFFASQKPGGLSSPTARQCSENAREGKSTNLHFPLARCAMSWMSVRAAYEPSVTAQPVAGSGPIWSR
jgi:hypothetical protein